jgi:hypothetical protein
MVSTVTENRDLISFISTPHHRAPAQGQVIFLETTPAPECAFLWQWVPAGPLAEPFVGKVATILTPNPALSNAVNFISSIKQLSILAEITILNSRLINSDKVASH